MKKIIFIFMPILLWGCATVNQSFDGSASNFEKLPLQRDKITLVDTLSDSGFDSKEARTFLEMCVELNNQDDRNDPKKQADLEHYSEYKAHVSDWKIVYDSRHPGNSRWNNDWPRNGDKPGDDPNNPETNGFGPFNNAWLLAQSINSPQKYVIVVRGTVGEIDSILADAFATTTTAYAGIEYPKGRRLPIVFAATPKAELHLGFTYAAFTLLFDKQRGILAQLRKLDLPEGATLFVTGHSQGAAIATLLHSFLYYAITDSNDRYKLNLKFGFDEEKSGNTVYLKSYLFAQPKPGNQQYAEDFARISKESSFVINNDLDPVTQVPLSLQTLSDVLEGIESDNAGKGDFWERMAFWRAETITEFKNRIRNRVAQKGIDHVAERFAKKQADLDLDGYFGSDEHPLSMKATSLNYTMAGHLIPVFGLNKGGNLYPNLGKKTDILLQHHATSYRKLMERQFR
ncbi:MAG: lipase family protein [Gammaproteobacteria bacterium]